MDDIIKNDPTLNYFINEAKIDWFNDFRVELRCQSLKIALSKYIEKLCKEKI